jgi:hypothetical protein
MEKTTHTLSNGQEIWLSTFTGEVVDQSRTSTVSVTLDAPTVLSTTLVVPGQVRSRTHAHMELWLRGPDGKERSIRMSDIGLAARSGHTVTVLWGATTACEDGLLFAARNHTTGEIRSDVLSGGKRLRAWRLKVGAGTSFMLWVGAATTVAAVLAFLYSGGAVDHRAAMALGGSMGGAVLGFLAWLFLGSNLGPERRAQRLTDEINTQASRALASVGEAKAPAVGIPPVSDMLATK